MIGQKYKKYISAISILPGLEKWKTEMVCMS